MGMLVRNELYWVSETDYLDSLEVFVDDRLAYYSRTYRYLDDQDRENTLMRWDNFQENHRQYSYFANSVREVRGSRYRPKEEIIRLVETFRRNIVQIELPP
jgi:hypothetical protein